MEFFIGLDPMLKAFWLIAITSSLIFLIQTVMTFMGTDAHDGLNADFNSDLTGTEAPFQLFSFRNLINFILGFSWTGISLFARIDSLFLLLSLSFLVGVLFVLLFFFLIKQIQRLAEDNSFNIQNTIGKTCDVYLSIPPQKSGKGKVMISVGGAFHELEAITEGEKIETGSVVKVIEVVSNSILIVEKI